MISFFCSITINLHRYGLAIMHLWVILSATSKAWQYIVTLMKYGNLEKTNPSKCSRMEIIWCYATHVTQFCVLDITLPICVFMVLYGKTMFSLSEDGLKYFIAGSIILTSRRFMNAIAKFPVIGGKVYMLTKVIK